MATGDSHKVRLLLSAPPVVVVLLGAYTLSIDPSSQSLMVVSASTILTFTVAVLLDRRFRRRLHERSQPIPEPPASRAMLARDDAALPSESAPPEHETANRPDAVALADAARAARDRLGASVKRHCEGDHGAAEIIRHLTQLDTLVGELTDREHAGSGVHRASLRSIIDDAVAVHALTGHSPVVASFAPDARGVLEGNPALLRAILFNFLISADPSTTSLLRVRLAAEGKLTCYFEGIDINPKSSRFASLLERAGGIMQQGVLMLPVNIVSVPAPAVSGRAELLAPTPGLNLVMTERLHAAGIDVQPTAGDGAFCVILVDADDPSPAIDEAAAGHSALPQLLVGATSPPSKPGMFAIGWPIHEAELEEALCSLVQPGRRRILTVDDDPAFKDLLAIQLQQRGLSLRTATSSSGARQALAEDGGFLAIVVDIHLDRENGIALASDLQREQSGAAVCLLTAGMTAEEEAAAREHELAVFPKPLDVDALMHWLAEGESPSAPMTTPDAGSCFDPALALRLTGERPELAEEVMEALMDGLESDLNAIRGALDAATETDRVALRDAAHRFSGSLQYCGAPRLRQAARTLDRVAPTASLQETRVAFLALEAEARELKAEYGSLSNPFTTSVVAHQGRE